MAVTICDECHLVMEPASTLCVACRAMRTPRPVEILAPPRPTGAGNASLRDEACLLASLWMSALQDDSSPAQVTRLLEVLRKRLAGEPHLQQELRALVSQLPEGTVSRPPQSDGGN